VRRRIRRRAPAAPRLERCERREEGLLPPEELLAGLAFFGRRVGLCEQAPADTGDVVDAGARVAKAVYEAASV